MNDPEVNDVVAPKDGGADGSVQLTSSLVRSGSEVLVSGLNVIVDGHAVEKHDLHRVNDELLRVKEGVAHILEFCDIVGANLLAVLYSGANLGYELAELVDTCSNFFKGAILKVLHGCGYVGDEGVDIFGAILKVINVLNLESANEDTINKLNHVKIRHFKRTIFENTRIAALTFWANR